MGQSAFQQAIRLLYRILDAYRQDSNEEVKLMTINEIARWLGEEELK